MDDPIKRTPAVIARLEKIRHLIKANDMSSADLARILNIGIRNIHHCIRVLRHEEQCIHICEWYHCVPGRFAPRFRFGPGKDAPQPKRGTEEYDRGLEAYYANRLRKETEPFPVFRDYLVTAFFGDYTSTKVVTREAS